LKVLLAVDSTQQADEAARTVRDCFPSSDVEILHVLDIEAVPHSHLSAYLIDRYHQRIRMRLQVEASRFLPKLLELFLRLTGRVRVLVREGPTADIILGTASSLRPDLVVLGSRGLTEIQARLLGGVSYRVAQEAVCPVLLIKHVLPCSPKMLLAVDRSKGTEQAVRFLETTTAFMSSRVILLAVGQPRLDVQEYVSAVASRLSVRNFNVETRILQGDPAATILQCARVERVDVIITGSRGLHGWLKQWLSGSVSRKIILHAEASVLIVHAQDAKEE